LLPISYLNLAQIIDILLYIVVLENYWHNILSRLII
jgi:hypothetical protein